MIYRNAVKKWQGSLLVSFCPACDRQLNYVEGKQNCTFIKETGWEVRFIKVKCNCGQHVEYCD